MLEQVLYPLVGGLILGIAASLLLIFNGRVVTFSGIFNGILQFYRGDVRWRIYFIVGLMLSGTTLSLSSPHLFEQQSSRSLIEISIGGLLVGFGALLATGCTYAHGLSGLARGSRRGIAAFIVIVIFAFLFAQVFKFILPGVTE
jgi:uncharacterized membrane protein YedE/YeeE